MWMKIKQGMKTSGVGDQVLEPVLQSHSAGAGNGGQCRPHGALWLCVATVCETGTHKEKGALLFCVKM